MLKALAPPLIASGLAALVGAVVGGLITYFVVTENTRIQLVMNAYDSYLPEAIRALNLARQGSFTKEDILRFGGAGAVLTIYGSEEVKCRSFQFERCLMSDVEKAKIKYNELAQAITEEALGREFSPSLEKCEPPPRDRSTGECPITIPNHVMGGI